MTGKNLISFTKSASNSSKDLLIFDGFKFRKVYECKSGNVTWQKYAKMWDGKCKFYCDVAKFIPQGANKYFDVFFFILLTAIEVFLYRRKYGSPILFYFE